MTQPALPLPPPLPTDPHSYAQGPDLPHLRLTLAVDFAQQTLTGSATWLLAAPLAAATTLVLDTRDLTIEAVEAEAVEVTEHAEVNSVSSTAASPATVIPHASAY